ncbi:MAG: hypothetical protein HYV23_02990 [Deltaproteobacteria bacterium]|nr:hypothetical protein [Deltaproteobacteria bacterium]
MSDFRFFAADYRECKADYIAFRNANREAARDEAYFEWRFLKKPGGCSPLVVWGENASGEKIGCVGFTRDIYMVNGTARPFGQLCVCRRGTPQGPLKNPAGQRSSTSSATSRYSGLTRRLKKR